MRRVESADVSGKVRPWLKNMGELVPDDGPFDLIWSEGALYCMGFKEGLAVCRALLTPGGLMGVSELAWFKPDPPDECRAFFAGEYAAMTDIESNLTAVRDSGFEVLGHFALPESDWMDNYYVPLERRLRTAFDGAAADDLERMEALHSLRTEIEIYRKHSNWYGYLFCLVRRR